MNERLSAKLKGLPDSPGVYMMKNAAGRIIYVGKAKNLKNRVRRYPYRTLEQSCRRAERIPGLRFYRLPRRSKERPADRAREARAECARYRP